MNEHLKGMIQTIDISSDVTGEPHEIAKSEIPMYGTFARLLNSLRMVVFMAYSFLTNKCNIYPLLTVNEVGHSNELQQNVYIRDIDDRIVKYFFKPNGRMKVGMPIELLTNYKNTYEGASHLLIDNINSHFTLFAHFQNHHYF